MYGIATTQHCMDLSVRCYVADAVRVRTVDVAAIGYMLPPLAIAIYIVSAQSPIGTYTVRRSTQVKGGRQ